jgi:hypothetical protein
MPNEARAQAAIGLWTEIERMLNILLATEKEGASPDGVGVSLPGGLEQHYALLPAADGEWDGWLSDETTEELSKVLKNRLEELDERAKGLGAWFGQLLSGQIAISVEPQRQSLLQRLEEVTLRIIKHFLPSGDPVRESYAQFERIDTYLFPLEYLTELREKDTVEIVRVSPHDAKHGFSDKDAADKTSGDALHHFGGFFKRSWRSNDILWGRLDTVDLLFESLLEPGRVGTVVGEAGRRAQVKARLAASGNPADFNAGNLVADLFAHSPAEERRAITGWLDALLGGNEGWRRAALRELEGQGRLAKEGMFERLIRAGQREILEEDLPGVIQDAIEQSVEWGALKRVNADGQVRYERLDFDSLVAETVKEVSAQVVAERVRTPVGGIAGWMQKGLARVPLLSRLMRPVTGPDIGDLPSFFQNRYQVGSEQIGRDIPPLILVQTISHLFLVLRNVVAAALERHEFTRWLVGKRFFRYVVEYPLLLVHGIARLAQRQPGLAALHVTVAVLAIAALLIGIGWRDSIWWISQLDGHWVIKLRWALVFIILPLLALGAQLFYLRWTLVTRGVFPRILRLARAVLLLVPAAIIGYGLYSGQYNFIRQWWSALSFRALLTEPRVLFLLGPALLLGLRWLLRPR